MFRNLQEAILRVLRVLRVQSCDLRESANEPGLMTHKTEECVSTKVRTACRSRWVKENFAS